MRLYGAVLATTFGRDRPRPLKVAVFRVSLLLALALAVGSILARSLGSLPFTNTPPHWIWSCSIIFVVEIVMLLVLLPSTGLARPGSDRLVRLLLTLPLKPGQRQFAVFIPILVLTFAALGLVFPSFIKLALMLGVPLPLLMASVASGVCASLGLAFGWPSRYGRLQIIFVPTTVGAQYSLLRLANNITEPLTNRYRYAVAFWLITGLLSTFIMHGTFISKATRVTFHKPVVITPLPYFLKKILRAPATQLGMIITLLMSLLITLFLQKQHLGISSVPGNIAMFLVAAFVTDVRPLALRHNPAEIANAHGSFRFVGQHLACSVASGVIATLPLVWLAAAWATDIPGIFMLAMQLVLAGAVGSFASTLIVPEHRDISGQCLSGLLCIIFLFIPPTLLGHATAFSINSLFYAGATLLFGGATWVIEFKRNKYTWRNYVVTNKL